MLTQEQQIFEQIKKADNILVTFKSAWSGDAVASSLALFLFLKKLGKNVEIAAEKLDSDKLYSFLPGYSEIKYELANLRKFIISLDITSTKVSQIKYQREENKLNFIISPKNGWFTEDDITTDTSGFKYGLIIAVGTPDLESLGRIYDNDTEFFYQTPLINLDHNSTNEGFGQINFIELTAVATAEIIFSLLDSYSRDLIDEDIATCLLAGMIAETKSFKTNNVTPRALLTASQLMSLGARREEIVNHLYRSKSLNVLKLWGRVLTRLTGSLENKLIWSTLSVSDFLKTNSTEKDLTDVIDELIVSIPQAKVIAIIYESETPAEITGQTPVSTTNLLLYAIRNINALGLIKELNPSGAKNLAKAVIQAPLLEAEKAIITMIQDKLNKLSL
ncbi:MAG: Phosphoesterase RecJ domain protein [Parcubacteria group bacterium GW2011_GWC2_42_12]|nr:MAG: Phosphoesterase RecJ domain protein [Parcubacteria group bacterium GW2011_GWC2_42_12]